MTTCITRLSDFRKGVNASLISRLHFKVFSHKAKKGGVEPGNVAIVYNSSPVDPGPTELLIGCGYRGWLISCWCAVHVLALWTCVTINNTHVYTHVTVPGRKHTLFCGVF